MMNTVKTLCVYCGAADGGHPIFQKAAEELGMFIAQRGFNLVYGGGRLGLMGLVASAALDHGGHVVGYIPELLDKREGPHQGIQELHIVDSMHTRKFSMVARADAFIILPGGFGTLDELFEVMTWRQLTLHQKPIFLLNIEGYWDPLVLLMQSIFDKKFAKEEHRNIVTVTTTPIETLDLACKLLSFGLKSYDPVS